MITTELGKIFNLYNAFYLLDHGLLDNFFKVSSKIVMNVQESEEDNLIINISINIILTRPGFKWVTDAIFPRTEMKDAFNILSIFPYMHREQSNLFVSGSWYHQPNLQAFILVGTFAEVLNGINYMA